MKKDKSRLVQPTASLARRHALIPHLLSNDGECSIKEGVWSVIQIFLRMDSEENLVISSFKGFSEADCVAYNAKLRDWRRNIIDFWLENNTVDGISVMGDRPEDELIEDMQEHEENTQG